MEVAHGSDDLRGVLLGHFFADAYVAFLCLFFENIGKIAAGAELIHDKDAFLVLIDELVVNHIGMVWQGVDLILGVQAEAELVLDLVLRVSFYGEERLLGQVLTVLLRAGQEHVGGRASEAVYDLEVLELEALRRCDVVGILDLPLDETLAWRFLQLLTSFLNVQTQFVLKL